MGEGTMRIVYVAAGAAGSYCGACTRDVTLARALIARGHDVEMLPLYTPIRVDGEDPSSDRVFYGGVNVYLEQKSALFRWLPRPFGWLLDRPALLRLASRFAVRTRASGLGAMTVSVLAGAGGRQRKELERLLRYLGSRPRPDVVNLTNSLLSGLAAPIRDRLGVPVVCTLQGEESFVSELPGEHRERAVELLRENARAVDVFIAPGRSYAQEMARFLGVPSEKVRVVRAGVDPAVYAGFERPGSSPPFRIGCLGRLSSEKGLDLVCEAFRIMEKQRPGCCTLSLAGQAGGAGAELWRGLYGSLAADGLADRVEYAGELGFREKLAFLSGCHALCVPVRTAEPRGMACLEAMATGLPVVAPNHGIFPEFGELTGGLVLVEPGDARALAEGLSTLRDDPDLAARMGARAAAGVAERLSASRMGDETLGVYRDAARSDDG